MSHRINLQNIFTFSLVFRLSAQICQLEFQSSIDFSITAILMTFMIFKCPCLFNDNDLNAFDFRMSLTMSNTTSTTAATIK